MNVVGEWMLPDREEKICSVTTGLVKNNWDNEHQGMLQVEYFLGTTGKNVTGWIPVAMPYAYKDCGMYALAEIGSEVVIAFNMGDRNCPIVIGCLWNKKNPLPDATAKENNTVKRFKTKGGCEVIFDDEKDKETIALHTPAGLTLKLDDEKQTISLFDKDQKNGLLLQAKEGSVTLSAEKEIRLKAGDKGTITLNANTGMISIQSDDISQKAKKGFKLEAQNGSIKGTQLDISGESKLSVQSSAIAQIKAATVKIN